MNKALPPNATTKPRRVLIVDDSRVQRLVLSSRLARWGFVVIEAADGTEALDLLERDPIPLILSDWIMPGLSGPELCHALRAHENDLRGHENERRSYFVLLTSKQDKQDVSDGLSAGADDFLTKPVDEGELLARLKAGLRLIDMQESLVRKNRQVTQAYNEVKTLYERIDTDLRAAATLQQQFLPKPHAICNGIDLSVHYQPAGHVGGDLVGYFPIGDDRLGLFAIDVSGHGVASSLLTIRLAQLFNASHPDASIAFEHNPVQGISARAPDVVVADLNQRFRTSNSHDLYFTIVYGILEPKAGLFTFCQAGHTHPLILRNTGEFDRVGDGGPPVGLLPGVEFEVVATRISPGDRLLLYSDGVIEAEDATGNMIGETGLTDILAGLDPADGIDQLSRLVQKLTENCDRRNFEDDVSLLLAGLPVS